MKTFNDLKKFVELAEYKYNSLNDIRIAQIKENGEPTSDLCRDMNAILYNISKACDCLEKGLNGEF